ncbi:MAG: hypothetical protein LH631_12295 [Alkalinema sp. CAN_BIN05]|nr:hypothetical protein [Alkalinema sp. CAN_BIN05]
MNSNDARSRSQTDRKWKTDRYGGRESTAYARATATTMGTGNCEFVTDTQIATVVFQVAPDGIVTILSSPSSYSYASVRSSS